MTPHAEPTTGSYIVATILPVKKDVDENHTDRTMSGNNGMLNFNNVQDWYPMPIPEDIFDMIEGCRYFTIMDMRQGFN